MQHGEPLSQRATCGPWVLCVPDLATSEETGGEWFATALTQRSATVPESSWGPVGWEVP